MRALFGLALSLALLGAAPAPTGVNMEAVLAARPAETLAAYRLFTDAGAREPNARVTPYGLNTILYSDGALKFRYVFMPEGTAATYHADEVFDFPVGTVLVKTFAFPADRRRRDDNIHFLETRLLIHKADGWKAYPYVWNAEGTEARYAPVGATLPVDFTGEDGAQTHLDWAVPNQNQCKGCHDHAGAITPIGPTGRNLNGDVLIMHGTEHDATLMIYENQLEHWGDIGLIGVVAEDPAAQAPRAPNALDARDGTLDERARAYLHVNCAHCHNPDGPAHTSGLDLRWSQTNPIAWGVLKRPVAAGRAAIGMDFDIAPGDPDHSILLHRMESLDPGIMMPELGRQTVDIEGVDLIREWIENMGEDGRPRS